jgi:tetratricopeptide (TPR) repeat protein
MPIRWLASFLAAGSLLLMSHSSAAACPLPSSLAYDAATALEYGFAHEAQCLNDARFLADMGRLLNGQKRYADATDRLERALMLEPRLPDALLEYVIALTGNGELASARNLLESLVGDPEMPESVRALLAEEQRKLLATPWRRRYTAAFAVGHDSNLLGAPNLDKLDLTLAGSVLTLPLSDAYLARGGSFMRANLAGEAQHEDEKGVLWQIGGQLTRRDSPDQPASDYTQFDLVVDRGDHRDALGPYVQGALSQLQGPQGSLYGIGALSAGLGMPWGSNCQVRGGLDAQERGYPGNRILDGRYFGAQMQWACRGPLSVNWALTARAGQDQAASADRPGGNQREYDLRLVMHSMVGPGAVQAVLEYASLRDQHGYSPLLDEGRRRLIDRRILRLEYVLPIFGLQWSAGIDYLNQSATIPLFQVRSVAPYVAVRKGW